MRGLEELERKWRADAAYEMHGLEWDLGYRRALEKCADDLANLRESWCGEAVAWLVVKRTTDIFTVESAARSYAEAIGGAVVPLFTHPAAEVVVTDDMVEIACAAAHPWWSYYAVEDDRSRARARMRAALCAALKPESKYE